MSAFNAFLGAVVVVGVGYAMFDIPDATAPPPLSLTPFPVRRAPPPFVIRVSPRGHAVLTAAADANGQFWIDGSANGMPVRFLVDTGASDIVLSRNDARRVGIDLRALVYDGRTSTANGIARVALAHIARLVVGPFLITDVSVLVIDGDLAQPLLGMALLRHMNFTVNKGTLRLTAMPS